MSNEIEYSEKYMDDEYEYRHVILPERLRTKLRPNHNGGILSENEWRSMGVQQSRGWVHYAVYQPEPHVLLFRRPLDTDPQTGLSRSQHAR
eukprot:UN03393